MADDTEQSDRCKAERGRRLVEILAVVIVLVAVGVTAAFWLREKNTEEVRNRNVCLSNLKAIGLGMLEYELKYGQFPPAFIAGPDGQPMHSWRVLILEFLVPELFARYNFQEPWDGPNNQKLADEMPNFYGCPNDPDSAKGHYTSYVVVKGPGTIFPDSGHVSVKDIHDGPGNTVMVVETADSHIPWMKPVDLRFEGGRIVSDDGRTEAISSKDQTGPSIAFADDSIDRITKPLSPSTLRALFTIDGNERVGPDVLNR